MTAGARKDERPRSGQPDGRPERQVPQQVSEGPSHVIGDWLIFREDGAVVVLAGKAEVGQGVRTSLAMCAAEELHIPLEQIEVVIADTAITPFDAGTFGSRTTPYTLPVIRKAAAAAREVFVERAAKLWGVSREAISVADGLIHHGHSAQAARFRDLMSAQEDGRLAELWSDETDVTKPAEWTVLGKAAMRVGGRDIVTGGHKYTTDLVRPGMLHAAVLRPPVLGARLVELDTGEAEANEGVRMVRLEKVVGVVAPDRAVARRGLSVLRAKWETGGIEREVNWGNIYDYLKAHPAKPAESSRWAGFDVLAIGSLEDGRAQAAHGGFEAKASYRVPYIAHAPLETRAAIAEWQDGDLTVYTGSQRPFGVRSELAAAFGMSEERIRVIVPDTGSAYGGKHTGDAAIEAAWLAREVGQPVKLTWTREEEFTWAYFRPAGLIEVSSAVDANGVITAWEYHNYNSGAAGIRTPYTVANQHIEFHTTEAPLRQGSYRALAATANHFARESHMDELAHMLGTDPLAFRLRNLPDESDPAQSRLRAVLMAAAEKFGWGSRSEAAQGGAQVGYGLACGTEKGSFVATCAEVHVDPADGNVRVVSVVEAFECGAIVNPDGLENQVEGAVVMGLGGALMEKIEFDGGKVLTNRFSRYRVPRFGDVPKIETVLLDRADLPSVGAGETPIVGIAPAIANAIFSATGVRKRDLPLGGWTTDD